MTAPKSPREGSEAAGDVCLSLSGSHDNWFLAEQETIKKLSWGGNRNAAPWCLPIKLPGENRLGSRKRTSS